MNSPSGSALFEDAVNGAIAKAGRSLHNTRWFEVTDLGSHNDQGKVGQWQVTMKIGFILDDEADLGRLALVFCSKF